jgi:exopolyphosphatase/guanosine-5'-triphosphate,3'-diphosphate pyrophosphatase
MERRVAIIDLGSNTCRLVIFAYNTHLSFRLVDQVSERLRISEGMFPSDPEGPGGAENRLQPEPMARAAQLLRMFRELCEANAIDRVIAVATSAVRDAANRDEFLTRVGRETGLELRVLSGEEEACYAYLGVVNSLAVTDGIIADLGGGSLELVRVRDRSPEDFASLPLGAVRLTEQFFGSDPIEPGQARKLNEYVDEQLERLKWLPTDGRAQLVVLGGTMRALAKMDQIAHAYPIARLHGYGMSRRALHDQVNELIGQPLKARKKIGGLKGERADVIPAGATVIFRLMKRLGAKCLTVSGQGLREGLFYEEFLRDSTRRSQPRVGEVQIPARDGGGVQPRLSSLPIIPDVRAFGIANLSYLYEIDWAHAQQVCDLSLSLFDQLRGLHRFGNPERALLAAAAVLHDAGVVIDYYRHHLHSAYIIVNADLPGFTQREMVLIALLVRWHRRGTPTLEPFEKMLDEGDFERVQKLSAILRLAEDLERGRAQVVLDVRCRVHRRTLEVEALTRGAASAELWAANRDGDIFESVYQHKLQVTATESEKGQPRPALPRENIMKRAERLSERLGQSR